MCNKYCLLLLILFYIYGHTVIKNFIYYFFNARSTLDDTEILVRGKHPLRWLMIFWTSLKLVALWLFSLTTGTRNLSLEESSLLGSIIFKCITGGGLTMESGLLKIFQEGKQNHGSRICPNPALYAAGSILRGSKAYAIHKNVSKK